MTLSHLCWLDEGPDLEAHRPADDERATFLRPTLPAGTDRGEARGDSGCRDAPVRRERLPGCKGGGDRSGAGHRKGLCLPAFRFEGRTVLRLVQESRGGLTGMARRAAVSA